MAESEQAGLHFKNQGQEVAVSSDSIARFLDSFERVATHFLDWSAANPYLFSLVIALMAFALFLRYRGYIEISRMKLEYEKERSKSEIQELPLPEPAQARLPRGTRK